MADEPMIKLEPGGVAPILSYNVPESTSYSGRNYIEIEIPLDHFDAETCKKPEKTLRDFVKDLDHATVKDKVIQAMKTGFYDPVLFRNIKMPAVYASAVISPNPGFAINSSVPLSNNFANIDPDIVAARMLNGERLVIYTSNYGDMQYRFVVERVLARPRLLLIESYRLSSYLGNYGAGRNIKTFSLLPGEKTKISVKSYTRKTEDAKSASSIFDSFTQESSNAFDNSVALEQSNKENYDETFAYHAEAEAEAG